MDYREAIETLQDIHDVAESRIKNGDARGVIYIPPDKLEDVKTAISALQELREYKENEKRNLPRTNRLMDECTYRHENGNCLKIGGFCTSVPTSHCQRYKELHNEYTEYKKLGTLEEAREAVELQQADKPRIIRISTHGAPDGYLYSCPNCEYRIIKKDNRGFYSGQRAKYCPDCGKRLDWSEKND